MGTLAEAFDRAATTPSDIWEHVPTLRDMAAGSTTIIELGVRSGVSTAAFLYGMLADGELWSVDLDPKPTDVPDDPRWEFIQGDDLDPDVLDLLPLEADIVFIDTSHLYDQTLAELNVYRWRVRPGGRIVLHDTELPAPEGHTGPPFPVKRAIDKFCRDNGLRWENRPNCWGLGIIHIPW